MKNLRQASLDKNVSYTYVKDGMCRFNIKRDIHVQKIKVKQERRYEIRRASTLDGGETKYHRD